MVLAVSPMNQTPQKIDARRVLTRDITTEAEGISDFRRDFLQFGELVVVRDDQGTLAFGEFAHLARDIDQEACVLPCVAPRVQIPRGAIERVVPVLNWKSLHRAILRHVVRLASPRKETSFQSPGQT